MKKILVPTDFSDCANAAAETAIGLAKQTGGEIDFLHLTSVPTKWAKLPIETLDGYPEEIRLQIGAAKNELNNLVLKAKHAGVAAKEYMSFNESVDEIYNHAKKHNCDLIVLGSHGSKGVREMFIGSNAQRVLRHAPVPVMVVKNAQPVSAIKNIVFAASFREDVHGAFAEVLKVADALKAGIHLLYINMPYLFEETKTTVARMKEFAKHYPNKALGIHIYNAYDEESGIMQFAAEHNIELVVLTTHGKSGWVQLLSPSIAESLVNHSEIPVLSIHAKK